MVVVASVFCLSVPSPISKTKRDGHNISSPLYVIGVVDNMTSAFDKTRQDTGFIMWQPNGWISTIL